MAAMVALHLSRSLVFFAYLCTADETKSSLGIRTGSKLEEVFEQSDADGNDVLQNNEETTFETQIQSAISDYWFIAPFEVTLYASDDCTGASSVATASSEETRCKQCFDVCGKAFSDSSSMAIADALREGGYASMVRSLRVQKGAVHVSNFFCFGRYNFGFNATSGGRVVDEKDGCINFREAAHLSAVDPMVLQTVTLYFLKEDVDRNDLLSLTEASDLEQAGIFRGADRNEDMFLAPAEYAGAMLADLAQKAASKNFMSSNAMEAAAVAATGPEGDSTNKAQLALAAFGDTYEAAKEDPTIGALTTTRPSISTAPNGQLIVMGGGNKLPVEYGDVDDERMVSGSYDPQNDGEVIMCTEGKLYHRGYCYKPCRYGYDDAQFATCFKTTCPEGHVELAGGLCKGEGLLGVFKTKAKESEQRAPGVLPDTCRLGASFGPGAQEDDGNRDFTVIIASDTQLPWCSGEMKGDMECAKRENWRMVQSMHNVESLTWVKGPEEKVAKPIGVHITGDLTAYAHENQIQEYRKIWETREGEDPNKNIQLPVWPGLGNHDYSNNLNACFFLDEEITWAGYGGVCSCAQRAIAYIRSAVSKCGGKTVVPNFGGMVDHYEHASAAYAVKNGKIRFVHLHNYPTFRRQELTGVASTMGFLRKEVIESNRTGDYLVLMIHDIGNKFGWTDNVDRMNYFLDITQGARILAMFAGHWHGWGGMVPGWSTFWDSRHPLTDEAGNSKGHASMKNAWGEEVPIVRGYAPDKQKFLVTQWNLARCFWRFGSIDTNATQDASKPVWHNSDDVRLRDQRNFTIPNCTVDEDYQPPIDFSVGSLSGTPRSRLNFGACLGALWVLVHWKLS